MATIVEIPLGLNRCVRVELRGITRTSPVIVFSSGFGTSTMRSPLRDIVIGRLRYSGVGSCNYLYPEREEDATTRDLLLSSGLSTLSVIVDRVRTLSQGPIVLCGSSFGASISLEYALLHKADLLVLTSPPIDYVEYRRRQIGEPDLNRWMESGSIDLDYGTGGAFRSSSRFLEEAKGQSLSTRLVGAQLPPLLALRGGDDPIVSDEMVEPLRGISTEVSLVTIPGMDHGFSHAGLLTEAADLICGFVLTGLELYGSENRRGDEAR